MSAIKRSLNSEKVTIKIPRALYTHLADTIEDSGFNSVTEFIVYVLRDLVSTQMDKKEVRRPGKTNLTKEEIEAIRNRLKSLGYL